MACPRHCRRTFSTTDSFLRRVVVIEIEKFFEVAELVGEERMCNANAISKRGGLPLFIDRKDAKQKPNDSLSKFLFVRFLTRPQKNANLSLEITPHCIYIIAVADVSTRLETRFAHLAFVREFLLLNVRQRLYVQSLNGYSPTACSRG